MRGRDLHVPMAGGFAYLVTIMDWKTRAVLSWKLPTLFCVEALREALEATGRAPENFNTDQGLPSSDKGDFSTLPDYPHGSQR